MKPEKVITWGDIGYFTIQALFERPLVFVKNIFVAALDETFDPNRIQAATRELREIEKGLR